MPAATHSSVPDRARCRDVAEALIAASQLDSAEYPTELANHLPMLLEIQVRLGAPADRLPGYAELYRRLRKVPPLAPPVLPLDAKSWRSALGDRRREGDLRRFFAGEVARLGGVGAIRRHAPVLAPGVGASALHALMRLAYGVLREDDAEIGVALGYWAATFLAMRDEPAGPPDLDDPLALAALMREDPAFRDIDARETDPLWHWMRAVGRTDAFAPLIGRLRGGSDMLDRVTQAGLVLFASAPHALESVHAMTGAWWVRQVSAHLDSPDSLVRAFWQAVLAVLPKAGMAAPLSAEALDAMRALPVPPDEAIAAAALSCDPLADDEEHHPSVVFTALAEYARTGDILYKVAAARRVGLLD